MKIIRAEHLGMCFGVKDAVALAYETARREPLTILGDLVHNETVVAELRAAGVHVAQQPADINTRTVMVTAHGASETTQPIDRVRQLVGSIRERFPKSEVRFVDTVCLPTKQRQNAAVELAQSCDVVVVIGGAHSNNTHELVKTCSRFCARVHHVQTAADLREDWFCAEDTVGITAGTSTPDSVIDEVEQWLRDSASSAKEIRRKHESVFHAA